MIFTTWHAIILAITEALTEFLPISSSAHLILVRELLHIQTLGTTDLAIDAVFQMGAIIAVLLYFWTDIKKIFIDTPLKLLVRQPVSGEESNMLWGIIAGTIPVIIVGILLEKTMETAFRHIVFVALFMFLGTVFMWVAQWYQKKRQLYKKNFTVIDGLWIGCAQVLALFSGFSRSGATISGGLLRGFSREDAVRFSFLLSFPAIVLSGLKKLYDLLPLLTAHTLPIISLVVGFFVSAILGFIVIHYLLKFVKTHSFNIFIVYRFVLVAVLLFVIF